jgi:hypothetical protein
MHGKDHRWYQAKLQHLQREIAAATADEAVKTAVSNWFPGARIVETRAEGKWERVDSGWRLVTVLLDHERYSIALTGEGTGVKGALLNALHSLREPIKVDGDDPPETDIPF